MNAEEMNSNIKELLDNPMTMEELAKYYRYKQTTSEEKAMAKIVKQRREKENGKSI